MRILHVIPGLTQERGGPTAVVQALVRHQAGTGHGVTVLTTDQGARNGEQSVELQGAAALIRAAVWGPDRIAYAPRFTALVRRHLRECDVAHVHSIFTYPVHVALREAGRMGVPVVLRPCGLLHRHSLSRSRWQKKGYLALWGRMVRRCCTTWHYTSEQEAEGSWPWDGSRRFILPNGIEPVEFALDPTAAREEVWGTWPRLERRPYVLFLGRLHFKKRLDLLLPAFLEGAPTRFKLVVAGPDESGLWPGLAARWLRDPAAASRVLRVGMVAGRLKAALLAGATLFVLPSEHENFGIAALEAVAAGTLVMLSPHVDLAPEVVKAGLGEAVPLDGVAWRERIAARLTDSPTPGRQADFAREWVRERYSWKAIAAELDGQYAALRGRMK